MNLHAENPVMSEYTLCGMAFDAYASGDSEEPISFACGNEAITCKHCRRAVTEIRKIKIGRLTSIKHES